MVDQHHGERVDSIRGLSHPIAVLVPAEIVTPVVAVTVGADLQVASADVEHLLTIPAEAIADDDVVLATSPEPYPDVVACGLVAEVSILRAAVEEHTLSIAGGAIALDGARGEMPTALFFGDFANPKPTSLLDFQTN